MKNSFFKSLISLFFICGTLFAGKAQDVSGIWKGYFISDGGEYYKLEFQVAKIGGYSMKGVSYSYLDVRFYGKASMTGSYISTSKNLLIKEIKTVEVKSTMGGATCIMNYNLKYSKSGKEEFLDGTYLGKYEAPYQTNPPGKWGDCGGGKVHLRRVVSSDFYVEPFLRNKIKNVPVIDNQPPGHYPNNTQKPITTKPPVKKPVTTTPPVKKPVVTQKPPVKQPVTTKPPAKEPVITTIKPPVKTIDTAEKKIPVTKVKPPPVKVPEILKTRSNELVKVLTVNSPEVKVKLYDNGQIDGDIISVYLDNKLIISSKMLTATPIVVNFNINDEDEVHELTMVAENLGSIPPNTSLMIVEAGTQRFDVRITSTEQKNAVVKFKYEKPK